MDTKVTDNANKLADGLIEKTISTPVEIASKTVYKKEYRCPLWKKNMT